MRPWERNYFIDNYCKGQNSKRAKKAASESVQPHSPPPSSEAPIQCARPALYSALPEEFFSQAFGFSGCPTTEFLGWRRLHVHEIVRLEVDTSVIIVIPSNQRDKPKHVKRR